MAKVVSVHEILLRWDAKEEEFEKFVADEYAPWVREAVGAEVRLLKGIRGDRMGRYIVFFEYPSTEVFTRFMPLHPGPFTAEGERIGQDPAMRALAAKYDSFVNRWLPTDYVETGK